MPSFSPRSRRLVVSIVISSAIIAAVLSGAITRAEFDPAAIFVPVLTATLSDTSLSGDGDGKADPGEIIGYAVQIDNTGPDPATGVTFSDTIDPNTTLNGPSQASSAVAVNDTFPTTVLGNVSISSGAFTVLTNDYLGTNPSSTITSFDATSANGGNVTMNLGTGTFTYDPPAGYEGTDTFNYVLADNANALSAVGNRTGTVSITVSGMVWFINNSASACTTAATNCGRLSSPYSTLAGFTAENGDPDVPASDDWFPGTGDNIFVYESGTTYTGGVTLVANQRFIGQDAQASLTSITGLTPPTGSPAFPAMAPGGTLVTITNTAAGGNGITLNDGNTVRGLTVSAANSSGIAGVAASNNAIIAGNNDVTITATAGVAPGTGALSFNGGNGAITFSGTISGNTGDAVNIRNRTGGVVTIQGPITSTTRGVFLDNNDGATILFTAGLSLSTGTSAAFTAINGGTVNATQNNGTIVNTLVTTTGTALNVANTTIGASGITFRSISSNGAANGIVLNTTGSSGGLTVTGDSGSSNNSSGGTIQNTTGHGISLTSTIGVLLDQMNLQSTGGSGISGVSVTNFSFTNGTVNDSGNAVGESNIAFNGNGTLLGNNIAGTLTITGSTLTNAFDGGIEVQSSDGTVSDATITGNTITSTTSTATSKGSGIKFNLVGTTSTIANLTRATISNNTITNFPSDAGIEVKGGNTNATGTGGNYGTPGNPTNVIAITNNAIAGQSAANKMGTDFIDIGLSGGNSGSRSVGNFNISNNGTLGVPMAHCAGIGIGFGNTGYATMEMVLNNNVMVLNNTVASPGIGGGNGIVTSNTENPDLTITVTNNNISQVDGNGILVVGRGVSGTLKTGIRGNTVAAPLTGVRPGIRVDAGNAASVDDAVCADISANTSGGSGGHQGIGVRKQGAVATVNDFNVEGFGGSTCSQVEDHIAGLNPGSAAAPTLGACDGTFNKRVLAISGSVFGSCNTAPVPPPGSEDMRFQEVVLGPYFTLDRPLPPGVVVTPEMIDEEIEIPSLRPWWTEQMDRINRGELPEAATSQTILGTSADGEVTFPIGNYQDSIDRHNALLAKIEALNSPQLASGEGIVGEAKANESGILQSISNFADRIFSIIMPTASAQNVVIDRSTKPFAPMSGETVTFGPINTLPAGKSVTIIFSVTVDTLDAGEIRTRILNQGSADSNETAAVLTTDPAPSVDPACTAPPAFGTMTCTPVDRPDTTINSINRVGSTPTNATSVSWTATFGTQIAGLTASNFALLNTAGPCSSPSITSVAPVGPSPATAWTIAASTGTGSCTLGLNLANDGGLSHDITTALPFVGQTIVIDKVAPSTTSFVRFNPLTSPTNADTLVFRATFSENVIGLGVGDFLATGTTASVPLSVVGVGGGPNFSVYDITVSGGDLAGLNGTVGLNFSPAMDITDIATNPLPNTEPAIDETYLLDNTPPTVNIIDVTPDPRNTSAASITIIFSEAVTGFDLADLTLTLNGGGNILTGAQTLTSGDNITWTLGNLSGITTTDGTYLLTLTAAGSGIADTATNALVVGATDSWIRDAVGPTVTINQAAGQSDPTFANPINFTAIFNEPVTDFDDASDVTVTGTAAGVGTATVVITPNSTTNYTVAISGITGDGTVVANIPASVAIDAATNPNAASTSTDNTVTFVTCVPPPPNMIAWYTGDGTPRDVAGGHDGSLVGGATYATGKVGQAFDLNGTNGRVDVADSNDWAFGSNNFSIDAWVNFDSVTGPRTIIGQDEGGGAVNKWFLWYNTNQLQFHINGPASSGPFMSAPFTPVVGTWYHIAMTRSGSTYTFYINGVASAPVTNSEPVPDVAAPLTIGWSEGAFYFDGRIDEVEVFNRALLQPEIQSIVAADGGGKCKPSDLRVAKSHVGSFTQGTTASYTVTPSNDGPVATSGTTTMTDTLPVGLTPGMATGSGWTCNTTLQTVTCTSTAAIAAGGSFPAITIPVTVEQNAGLSLSNTATVSGGGQMDTSDDSFTDPTTIIGVAQTPSVTNATTVEDTQTTSGLVISRNATDGNEVTHFKITSITNGTLFQNDGVTPIANNAFITFAEGNAGLKFTPSANFFGNGSFTVQASISNSDAGIGGGSATATITVNAVADTPSVTNATTNEDVQTTSGLVISRNPADGVEVTHFKITGITNGTLFQNDGTTAIANNAFITFAQGNAGLKFTPTANFFGNGSFQVQSSTTNNDSGLGGGLATATITVNAVADTPSVTNATTVEDTQTTSGLVISRNVADGPEVTHFKITAITNGTLFQNDGTTPIANNAFITFAQGNAGLRFTPNANFFGNGTFQIQASTSNADAGLGGGVITATITVNAVADTPSVTNATTNEDVQTTSGLVISRNAADGAEVTHFKITAITNGTLFQNDGTTPIANNAFITFAQGNAGLKFTPNANFFGNGTFQIQASVSNADAGLGGGVITATITVNPVADTPSATNATTNEDTQTISGLVISRNAADGAEVTHFKITNITNGTLFQNDGVTPIASNAFITFAQGNAGLKFTPNANFFGNGTFQVQASLANNDGGLGGGVITVTITVNPVADTPSVTNSTTNEDTQTTTGLVVSRNAADGSEVTHFKITNITNGTLFQNDGTTPIANNAFITFAQANAGMKFTPVANQFSPATPFSFQVQASISGADAGLGGGVVTATITVNPVADTPSVTNATTVHGAQTTSGLVVSRNAVDGAEVTHFKITNIQNGTLFQNNGTTPIANNAFITFAQANAGLKFTPNIGFIGTATFQIQASVSNVDAGLGGGVITANIVVNKADTTTTIVSSLNPSPLGAPVTFTSTTVITPPGQGPINGSVTFLDGATPIAGCSNVAVNAGGQAQCTTSTLTSGSHVITAQYLGSATFNMSSGTVTQVVDLPPTAAGTAPTVVTGGGTTHTVTVTYTDDFAINVASLDSNDIRVTGPNAFNSAVTFTGVNINTNGTPRVATYTFTAPGGSWDIGDNGTYSIVMQANQVVDSANQPVAAGSIGTFVVNIPPVTISGNIRQYVAGGPNTPLAGVTVTLTSNNVPVPGPATTNANGDYVIANVSHGANVVVTPSGLGKVYDPLTRTFNNVTTNTTANFIAYDPNAIPRTIRVVDTYPAPGAAVAVPIVMNSQGTETFVSFSLNYNTNPLANNPTAACGAGTAPGCTVTFNNATSGQIGVTITNPVPFTTGPVEIAVINFQTLANNLGSTPLTFGDAPVVRLVRDGDGNPLPATYINGLMVFAQGLEGDVANRNTGNGMFESADVVQMRRFVAGLDTPVATNNEFQRADTAPAATKGDGNLNSTDLVQTRRYVAGLDPSQTAGGPGTANAGPIAPPELERSSGTPEAEISLGKASGSTESRVTIPVGMRSNGDEVAVNFVVRYDAARLGNAAVQLVNAPEGATLTANTDEPGVIRVLVDSSVLFARLDTIETLVNISFDIASTAPTGDTRILIDETTVSDARANSLAVKTTNGTISIAGPNAVAVEISGRVLAPNGSGLRNAIVTLTDANGVTRTATTATFGYYRFEGVSRGETYTLAVSSRRFRFTQQQLTPSDNLTGIDFAGQE